MKVSPRATSTLSASLQKRLNAYAIATSAASVGLLALAQPSEAEVVYTPANQTIDVNHRYSLDLNHDGTIDFTLFDHRYEPRAFSTRQILTVKAAAQNLVNCPSTFCISSFINAGALEAGTEIGPNETRHGWLSDSVEMAFEDYSPTSGTFSTYQWVHAQDKYLGLQFQINGEIHYGWARLSVHFHGGPAKGRSWEAHLSGYAYETVAGKSIRAGQTSGPSDKPGTKSKEDDPDASLSSDKPAQLGALAVGSSAIPFWRRGT
jgi:hypothetical protein